MKAKLLATVATVGLLSIASANAALLTVEVFDGATQVGVTTTSSTGTLNFTGSDANFSSISVDVNGVPVLPNGDLSSTTLQASAAAGFTGPANLTVDIFQTGLNQAAGDTNSTFTANSLVGAPGPATETTYQGGSDTVLGNALATASFAAGVTNGSQGPDTVGAPAFNADAQQYVVTFSGASQSFGGSIELTTASSVPESSTWAMIVAGFGLMGLFGVRKAKTTRSLFA